MELLDEFFFNEVKIFHLEKFEDNRGFFLEKYHTKDIKNMVLMKYLCKTIIQDHIKMS